MVAYLATQRSSGGGGGSSWGGGLPGSGGRARDGRASGYRGFAPSGPNLGTMPAGVRRSGNAFRNPDVSTIEGGGRNRNSGALPYDAAQAAQRAARAAAGAGARSWGSNFAAQQAAARATLASIMGNYAAADAPFFSSIADANERARIELMASVGSIDNQEKYARQGSVLDQMNVGISQRVATADMNMVQELLALNNQSFGVALTEGKGMLDRYGELDKFAQESRQFDIRDLANQRAGITEDKRLADFNVSGKAGAESGIASGSARMGFMANKTAEALGVEKVNVLDARSDQELRKSLSENKFGRDKVNWDLQKAGISRREQELSLQSRQRTLQAEADRLNISRKKLELELAQQLDKFNLSRFMSVGQFADAVGKGRMSFDQLLRDRATQLSQDPRARAAAAKAGRVR